MSIVTTDNVPEAGQGQCSVCLQEEQLYKAECGHLVCEGCMTTVTDENGQVTNCDNC